MLSLEGSSHFILLVVPLIFREPLLRLEDQKKRTINSSGWKGLLEVSSPTSLLKLGSTPKSDQFAQGFLWSGLENLQD